MGDVNTLGGCQGGTGLCLDKPGWWKQLDREKEKPEPKKIPTPQKPSKEGAKLLQLPSALRPMESYQKAIAVGAVMAGVTLIAATLAEDFLTGGIGILNDGPTIAAGLALIRSAR